jgi:hypothetical protein
VPILSWSPGASPEAPGTLSFYEQGSAPSSGFQVSSKGAILSAISAAWQGATAAAVVASAIVAADTFDRFRITADGGLAWGPGNLTRDTNLYRSGAGALQTDGFFAMGSGQSSGQFSVFGGTAQALRVGTAGGGLSVAEGTNARMGTATLVAGTATVSNTSVTANTRIFLTAQTSGAAPGALRVSARVAGTSFTVTSSSGTDTSQFAYLLVEPAA